MITDSSGNEVWRWDSALFGETQPNEQPTQATAKFTFNLRFPGQYYDSETSLHYNYFRDYDPQAGRYVQSDPIGLEGGINTYAYLENTPLMSIDPRGLKKWDFNGRGNTNICSYYDQRAKETCGNLHKYYETGAQICRGNRPDVNLVMDTGITVAWTTNSTDKSQSDIYNQVRGGLIQHDSDLVKQQGPNGITGNMIDSYHDQVFDEAGIVSFFYGGNRWPQGVWPNPVPFDPNEKGKFDPRRMYPNDSSENCQCKTK